MRSKASYSSAVPASGPGLALTGLEYLGGMELVKVSLLLFKALRSPKLLLNKKVDTDGIQIQRTL